MMSNVKQKISSQNPEIYVRQSSQNPEICVRQSSQNPEICINCLKIIVPSNWLSLSLPENKKIYFCCVGCMKEYCGRTR